MSSDAPRLTPKQHKFVLSYAQHLNASRAAREAGYPEASCRQVGWENLTKPVIKKALKGLLDDYAASAEEMVALMSAQARGESPTKTRIVRDHEGNETVTEEYDRHSPADKLLKVHGAYESDGEVLGKLLIVRSVDEVFDPEAE